MKPRFAILNPCPRKWQDLHGDSRQRFCEDCGKHVHAIEQYSAEDFDNVWKKSGSQACGYIAGVVQAEPRSRRAVLLGALLTAVSPLMAQTGSVRIRVTDRTGAVIAGAYSALVGTNGVSTRTIRANDIGEVVWTDLPMGNSRFKVTSTGFASKPLVVTVQNGEEIKLEAQLQVGTTGGLSEIKRRRWLFF